MSGDEARTVGYRKSKGYLDMNLRFFLDDLRSRDSCVYIRRDLSPRWPTLSQMLALRGRPELESLLPSSGGKLVNPCLPSEFAD